jgi:TRAP-type C4-dicarboxylate transport system substrate-binding protein
MRKLFSKSIFMMLLSAAVVFSFGSSGWSADKVVIKMASEYNEKHPTAVNGWMPWIQDLKNKTNGGLEIQFYNPNTLVPAAEMYNAVVNGSADMAVAASWRNFGVFPLDEVAAMPLLFNGSEAGSMTIWDLHQKYPEWQAEYKAIKPLWQHVSATLNLHTKKKEIKSVADLKGMKIIGWGATSLNFVKLLGANPIESSPQDTYLALERGMADGVLCPLAPLRSFKISDATKFHTIIDLYVDTFWAGMNLNKWNSLPDPYRKILTETTGANMARISGKTLDTGAREDVKWLKANGHTFYKPSKEEIAGFKTAVAPVVDKWMKDVDGRGYKNAKQIYEDTMNLAAKYSAETEGGYK